MNTATDISVQKEVSCRVTNSVFKYLESKGYNCDSITEGLPYPYSREYLSDPLNWVAYEIRETICRRAAELTKDDAVMFKVGLSTTTLNPLGGVESIARKLTGPKMVYRFVPKYARLLDRVFTFKTTIIGKSSAVIEMRTEEPEYKPSKDSCYYAQGILAAVPTLWGLPPAEIHEKKCMYNPVPGTAKEGVQYEAEACVYEVNWQPLPSRFQRFRDNVISRIHLVPGPANFKELEQNLRHIDQKNIELIARNKQLAAVREIAMGVDKVRTIDEALSLAVEQARDIEGVRFVIVQTLDEAGEYITTPYYSKIRYKNVLRAIKNIGFDPEKELGKSPTSNKLRFKLSKIKIAQDYISNPRVIVMPSLADLLDGAMPRALCNAIQTILRVKKLVLVPLLAENKLWGNILFFLTQDVPLDILEMIGTHCGLALNNIINTNNLVSRNTELVARNSQLAVVREIALGVDKVRTIGEALSFVVDQAREIEGIRFVLVQKLDESKEYVTTPYYSKIRPQNRYMANAIGALGFDVEKELGQTSTSNKLRFKFSKLKAAQDYVRNPRTMVFPSLAELLDGIWPRILCNGIQKIMGVKKLVVVPIMVESESWGSLLFFLTHDVPLDILEMIGAHCAQSVKNIGYMETLAAESVRKRILIDESLDGIVILDDNAAVVEANQRFAEMLGYTPDEVRKLHSWDWDIKWKPETLLEMGRTVGSGSEGLHIETQHRRKDGTLFDVDISINGAVCDGQKLIFCVCRDVTERKRMVEALQESEEKFSKAFHASPEAIALITLKDEKYIDINDSYTQMTGYSREELIGNTAYSIHIWATPEEHTKMRKMMQEQGRIYNEEFDYRTKSGEVRTRLFSLEPITINGEPCTIGVSTDITERKKAEEALQESEERYRTIFESANDVLILMDNKGKIVDVNDRIKDIGGYNREELIGRNIRSLSNIMTKKSLLIVVGNFLKRMAGLEVPFYDVEMIKSNGERLIIQINAIAVHKEGKIIGDLAVLRDVTEVKQAEKNLKLQKDLIDRILATIPNAVLLLNKKLNVIIANQSFYNLFKLKKNQVESKPFSELIISPDLDRAIKKVLGSKEEKTSTEFRYYLGSSEKMLLVNIFTMEKEYLLLVINDVTEEREKQERLYLTDRLVSVGEMAAGVAHEINNPLTSVIGLSSLLTKQDVPESIKEDLNAIYSEAQRCASIVKNLLTFARKHVSRKEPLHIVGIVNDVLKLRAYEHRVNNIAVETAFPPDLPEVIADYFEIQQVFVNIILNAETAMIDAHGRGTLKISAKAINNHIAIYFSDDGPGISKENMRSIFNPFFTTKEVGKGTGLGLSICYGIVASHGGKIYANSEFGKGATFVVELPTHGKQKG